MDTQTQAETERVSSILKMKIDNFEDYGDGFSFTVESELEAYKAAYIYRFVRAVVTKAAIPGAWLVQIYNKKD